MNLQHNIFWGLWRDYYNFWPLFKATRLYKNAESLSLCSYWYSFFFLFCLSLVILFPFHLKSFCWSFSLSQNLTIYFLYPHYFIMIHLTTHRLPSICPSKKFAYSSWSTFFAFSIWMSLDYHARLHRPNDANCSIFISNSDGKILVSVP